MARVSGLTVCAVLSAVVLIVSGIAKVRSRQPLAQVMDGLGLPGSRLPGWLLAVLPWAEVGLGVVALVVPGVPGAVVAAMVVALFVAYTVIIARTLARAEEPVSCNCFGDLAPSTVTKATLARNLVLVVASALGLVAAIGDHRAVVVRIATGSAADWWWWLGVVVSLAAVVLILHEPDGAEQAATGGQGAEDQQVEGQAGDDYISLPTPLARVTTTQGHTVTLREISRSRPQLLLFVMPGCGPCQSVLTSVESWTELLPEVEVRCVVGHESAVERLPEAVAENALIDAENSAGQVLEVRGFPTAWLLGVDQRIAGGPQTGPSAIADFVNDIRASLDEAMAEYQDAQAELDEARAEQEAALKAQLEAAEQAQGQAQEAGVGQR